MAERRPDHPLAQTVRRTIRRRGLLAPGHRVLIALSGGPDSVALTHVLRNLARDTGAPVVAVAHLNHQLRPSADEDEVFCREFAARLALPVDVGRAPVAERARAEGRSIEDAARQARYAFLEEARARAGATHTAVGHTRNDQAETLLLRLVRGAGSLGLAGIFPAAGPVVRPLIDVERDLVLDYLAAHELAFRSDESNADLSVPRNRVRHELIPYLARHFCPSIVEVLARDADLLRDDAQALDVQATELAARVVLRDDGSAAPGDGPVAVELAPLNDVAPGVRRRVLRLALQAASGGRFVGAAHVEALEAVAAGETGPADLPGLRAELRGARLCLIGQGPSPSRGTRRRGGARQPEPAPAPRASRPLEVGGPPVVAGGWAVWVERDGSDTASEVVSAAIAELPGRHLRLRTRRPGDRLRPVGLGGTKKLQDLFVDRKIPQSLRDDWPIVVDEHDRIIWVVGLSLAGDFAASAPGTGVITLKCKRLGGSGG